MTTKSETIEVTLRRRRILFADCGVHEGYETAEVLVVRRIDGGRGLRVEAGQ